MGLYKRLAAFQSDLALVKCNHPRWIDNDYGETETLVEETKFAIRRLRKPLFRCIDCGELFTSNGFITFDSGWEMKDE